MKQKIAMMWAEALESGEYLQTGGTLRKDETLIGNNEAAFKTSFCCLGVLCNLHAQTHPKLAATQTDSSSYLGEEDYAPKEVMKWSGLKTQAGQFKFKDRSKDYDEETNCDRTLADLNDEEELNFNQIAAVIRKNWRKL